MNALALFWVTNNTQGNGRDRSADEPPRLSNVVPQNTAVTAPRKSTFFDGPPPATAPRISTFYNGASTSPRKEYFDYLPSSSRPRLNLNEVSVVPPKSLHHKTPSIVQKVAKLFRSSSERSQEEHGLQVSLLPLTIVCTHSAAGHCHSRV